jgi:hypothetical protein
MSLKSETYMRKKQFFLYQKFIFAYHDLPANQCALKLACQSDLTGIPVLFKFQQELTFAELMVNLATYICEEDADTGILTN